MVNKEKLINNFFKIILLLVILFTSSLNVCKAFDLKSSLGDLEQYGQVSQHSDNFEEKVGIILGAIQLAGSLIAVICLIVLGIKYMMGSIEEKAEYKKTLLPYFIGAMMVFGIINFLKVIYDIMINIG